jgi:hypothetical protein
LQERLRALRASLGAVRMPDDAIEEPTAQPEACSTGLHLPSMRESCLVLKTHARTQSLSAPLRLNICHESWWVFDAHKDAVADACLGAGVDSGALHTTMAVELECLSGLCTMLAHQLDTLEASQQPVRTLLDSSTTTSEASTCVRTQGLPMCTA